MAVLALPNERNEPPFSNYKARHHPGTIRIALPRHQRKAHPLRAPLRALLSGSTPPVARPAAPQRRQPAIEHEQLVPRGNPTAPRPLGR